MHKSIPLSELNIQEDTRTALSNLGYTETGNFIDDDDLIFVRSLTRKQFINLAIAIAEIKAGGFWDEERK